ncbi:MAG: phosphate ABC transporter permease subunit PstC [Gammaproteobacteria bacterium RIFCSPLOWO2_02_FULL_57_10]|nr:MAG: phosphate ABC transporter permease subunit PstC [Gammaproteobacteria bacterium RIFCSPLOWO2_02_FULL_57_10]
MFLSRSDAITLWTLRAFAAITAAITLLIAAFLLLESGPALQSPGLTHFFTDRAWFPASATPQFNLAPMIAGSLLATLGALLIAVPLGIAAALFSRFYAPPFLALLFRRLLELLAGIPSVVYGFWGLVVLTPLIREWQPPGQSLLAAILILSLMILPTIALLSETALRSIPQSYLQGAAALGLSRHSTIVGVALPAASSGIISAVVLATGRAIGETMAVLMVAGNIVQVPDSLFAPVRTLTANIALELAYALDGHRAALFVSGLLLMALVVVLTALSHWVTRESQHA